MDARFRAERAFGSQLGTGREVVRPKIESGYGRLLSFGRDRIHRCLPVCRTSRTPVWLARDLGLHWMGAARDLDAVGMVPGARFTRETGTRARRRRCGAEAPFLRLHPARSA